MSTEPDRYVGCVGYRSLTSVVILPFVMAIMRRLDLIRCFIYICRLSAVEK